eukprot:TRINITY_DN5665_c0_g1_i8.p1 TRINITY_DN5665_c0_g1~~TRINITY_DN5665_c0_g1_i8.p1  ORF type:complete len:144 (+),score=28.01 TRINITY_DN5665_c0_g1_i8:222-653(+)
MFQDYNHEFFKCFARIKKYRSNKECSILEKNRSTCWKTRVNLTLLKTLFSPEQLVLPPMSSFFVSPSLIDEFSTQEKNDSSLLKTSNFTTHWHYRLSQKVNDKGKYEYMGQSTYFYKLPVALRLTESIVEPINQMGEFLQEWD